MHCPFWGLYLRPSAFKASEVLVLHVADTSRLLADVLAQGVVARTYKLEMVQVGIGDLACCCSWLRWHQCRSGQQPAGVAWACGSGCLDPGLCQMGQKPTGVMAGPSIWNVWGMAPL